MAPHESYGWHSDVFMTQLMLPMPPFYRLTLSFDTDTLCLALM